MTIPGVSSTHAELSGLSWALRSHPGQVRAENEDSVGAFAPREFEGRGPLFVVADGMGGHAAGEVASRIAVESILREWTSGPSGAPRQALRAAARVANGAVFAASLDVETRGMGTTLTALALSGRESIVAHVGDSRAYLVREGQCTQLTADHSRVGEMLRMRLITLEQAARHPARSQLTRCLGPDPAVQIDLVQTATQLGDTFVLCSDGLWDLVSRAEIAQTARGEPDDAAHALLDAALGRGAPDNVSVIVVRLTGDLPTMPSGRGVSRLFPFAFGRS